MGTTSTAAFVMAASANSQASDAAAAARRAECRLVLEKFEPKGAQVGTMQEYAFCVQLLHPTKSQDQAVAVLLGFLLLTALIGAAVTVWLNRKSALPGDRVMLSGLGFIGGGTSGCLLALAFWIVATLFF